MFTDNIVLNLEFLGCSVDDFLQRQLDTQTLVATTEHRALALTASCTSAKSAKATKTHSFEYIAEMGENIVDVAESSSAESACTAHAFMSELVVTLTFLGVMQHFVSFCGLFEFVLCIFVARIAVGMVLDGEFLVSFLDFVFACGLLYAQHFVVVSFCHIPVNLLWIFYSATATLA